jgi:ADP-ribosylglycohydrolase
MESADTLLRATAALRALAAGDAMGRATEYYTPAEIAEVYEDAVTDFLEPVRLFDEEAWEAAEVGPPTRLVLARAEAGDAAPAPPAGDVAALPVAVARGLARSLEEVLAAGGESPPAVALAAAVSAAVEGHPARAVFGYAVEAARAAGDGDLAERILRAGGLAQASGGRWPGAALRDVFPPDGDAATVTAFTLGLVYATQSARRAILEAVNQGGHAPETAGISGAICAAIVPTSLPEAWGAAVERHNGLDLARAARRLVGARGGHIA